MSYINLSGISVAGGFALKSKQPLDARLVVPSLESLDPKWVYTGIVVYVSEGSNKGLYVYTGESDGWKPIAIASNSSTPDEGDEETGGENTEGGTSNVSIVVEGEVLKISVVNKTE